MADNSFQAVMARRGEILRRAVGIDYSQFEQSPISFDFEGLLNCPGYSLAEVRLIQAETGVGNTPLVELKNITRLMRRTAPPGKGARIFVKDERCNPSGSFKDRRASLSVYHAARKGYKGIVAATSGNYGAAIASQAVKYGLKTIIIQEVFDSRRVGQPEVLEKTRACEAYGAEVWQMTVGPELFYLQLRVLEETGFFNGSLYTPMSILGIETLGDELARQSMEQLGRFPDMVIITHAGGGNVTGTARGLQKAGACDTIVAGASVDLRGLHMASDADFNRKSFTTGHTGYAVPFLTLPDRTDVPRSCARGLRYLDRFVLVTQGDVFYVTQLLAKLEGLERGPAGNTSLTAAFALARELDRDQIVVVQETEYTAAGKLPSSQLTFAQQNGVVVRRGDPRDNVPGKAIVIPERPEQIQAEEFDLEKARESYIQNALKDKTDYRPQDLDVAFLAADSHNHPDAVRRLVNAAYPAA
jgi:2-amino-4-ketopentanoate thiolase beta subunit